MHGSLASTISDLQSLDASLKRLLGDFGSGKLNVKMALEGLNEILEHLDVVYRQSRSEINAIHDRLLSDLDNQTDFDPAQKEKWYAQIELNRSSLRHIDIELPRQESIELLRLLKTIESIDLLFKDDWMETAIDGVQTGMALVSGFSIIQVVLNRITIEQLIKQQQLHEALMDWVNRVCRLAITDLEKYLQLLQEFNSRQR